MVILRYILRRILLTVPTLLVVILVTFTLGFYGPGDPVRVMFGVERNVSEDVLRRARARFGLDQPYPVQLANYAAKLARGDFGHSIILNRDVKDVIAFALPVSAQVGLAAMALMVFIGVPLGILAAVKQNTTIDYVIITGAVTFQSIPVFVLAPLLMIVLILNLHLIPSTVGWDGVFSVKAILPIFTLAAVSMLEVIRYTRSSVLEVLGQDYVRTARAKGLPERLVVARHILKNSMTPVITALGLSISGLITGSLFIETIFGIPGFGRVSVTALQAFDYPLVLGATTVGALIIISSNLVVDLIYGVLDPRVRTGYE